MEGRNALFYISIICQVKFSYYQVIYSHLYYEKKFKNIKFITIILKISR